ncbi:MAG: hypothetical protein ACLFST_00540 [Spirochaetia bacterium]
MDSITSRVLEFQQKGKHLSYLIGELGRAAYDFPYRRRGFDEDDRGEFYLYVFPRTVKLLHQFRYRGKSFNSYLHTVLKWQLRSYLHHKEKLIRLDGVKKRRYFCYTEESDEIYAAERGSLIYGRNPLTQGIQVLLRRDDSGIITETSRRRILILTLKEYRFIDDGILKRVSDITGYDLEKLFGIIDTIHFQMEQKIGRLKKMKETRNNLFFILLTKQEQAAVQTDPAERRKLKTECENIRSRIRKLDKRYPKALLYPPNKLISELLGIPKGSVDSSLYYVRKTVRMNQHTLNN